MRSVRLFAALVCFAVAAPLGAQQITGTLVVANRAGGSISFIDLGSGVEMARHAIGARVPHEVAISPNGRIALTSEYGPNDDPGRRVLVFDVPQAVQIGEIDLGPQTRPHSLAFLPDGRRAVVTMEQASAIALIDVFELRVIDTFTAGGSDNHMVRVSPDGDTAYVTGRGGTGTLSIVDLTGARETVVIETGEGAEGLGVSPDGSEVWVANRRAGTVSVIDTRRQRVIETIDAAPFVGRAEISAAGQVVVSNGSFGGVAAPQQLTLYDLDSNRQVARHGLRAAEDNVGGFNLHIAGNMLFTSDRTSTAIVMYDLNEFPAASTVLFEQHDYPDGIGYSPLRMNVMSE